MNKDKLISLIIKKQTYKETKTYLQDLAQGKQQAAKVSAEAVRDIITTQYIAQAKLYALRYLKDAFEQGNPAFISLVENSLLPLLLTMATDEADEKAIPKYAGTTYTKQEELAKFKSILSSLFRMAKQCILKWASWIPYPNHKFAQTAAELRREGVQLNFEFKYFRPENQQLFIENCNKNNVQFNTSDQSMAKKTSPRNSNSLAPPTIKTTNSATIIKDPLIDAVENAMHKFSQAKSKQQYEMMQNDFNENLNNYLENATDFKEDLVQRWFQEFENMKTIVMDKIQNQSKGSRTKESKVKQTATPTGDEVTAPKEPEQSSSKEMKKASVSKTEKRQSDKTISTKKQVRFEQESRKQVVEGCSSKSHAKAVPESKKKVEDDEFVLVGRNNEKKQGAKISDQCREEPKVNQPSIEIKRVQKQKSPKASSVAIKIPNKGPIIFESEQSSFSSHAPKQFSSLKQQNSQPEHKSKPEVAINKIPRPSPEDVRSPKVEDNRSGSKWLEDSLTQKINSAPKIPLSFEHSGIKVNVKEPSRDRILPVQLEISKESERVTFSEEEESEQDVNRSKEASKFKKKGKLAAIEQAFDQQIFSPIPAPVRGKIDLQMKKPSNTPRSFNSSKLLQQNNILTESISKMAHELQLQKNEKLHLQKQVKHLSRELQQKQQSYNHLLKKVKASVPMQDYNILKKELEQYKKQSRALEDEKHKLQTQQKSIISQFREMKDKLDSSPMHDRSNILQTSSFEERNMVRGAGSPMRKEDLDQDYVKNLTHPSNIHNWLNQVNTALFKKSVLGLSQIYYRDDYLTILARSSIYTQNDYNFLTFTFTFQFKSLKQVNPAIRYKNCQEVQIWTKPLTGDQLLYTQQIILKLHKNPTKILKAQIKIIQGMQLTFLVPAMYFSFLREEEVSQEQFDDVYTTKSEQVLKSKIISLNTNIFKESIEIKKIFRHAIVASNKIRFCLAEGINDNVFLGQFQLLRNNKVLLKMLSIPASSEMQVKTRQLLDDLSFLIS